MTAIISNYGQANGTGDVRANFLKVAMGEVLTAFTREVDFMDKHQTRSIANGKSASFPVTGRTSGARYHTPGTQVLGTEAKFNERVITIDDLLLTDHFIANILDAMNHFEVRSEITKQMGEELAQAFDRNVAQTIILAARASAVVDGLPSGGKIANADFLTDSDALADAAFDAAAILDEKHVTGTRYMSLKPVQYYALARNTSVINRDWDGRGSYAEGNVVKIADIAIHKAKTLPNGQNITTGPTKYQGDFSDTAGVVFTDGAAGTVKLMDIAVEDEYMVSRQGTLLVAKYAVGHGILRPECAIELTTDIS